jgi:glycosyltransferase involved in cell wall biosynthesis
MSSNNGSARPVLYVEGNTDGTIGGSYFSLLFLVSGLDRERFDPRVVFARENELLPRFHASKVQTFIVPPASPVRLRGSLGRICAKAINLLISVVWQPLHLAAMLRRERIALVHLNNSIRRNHPWIMAAWFARVPCITHERGINEEFQRRDRVLARRLRAVICISEAVEENFIKHGFEDLRLVTIHNGLDPNEMRVTRDASEIYAEQGIVPTVRLIGIVGNIKPWKGQELVIRAMDQLRNEFPDVVCLLIGDTPDGENAYRLQIDKLIEQLNLGQHVFITGYRHDVANYVNALEIQVHASVLPEPFGRVLLEGMALSKPLVASNAGGVPEIVVDGATGLLFEPQNAESLVDCLRTLLADPDRARRLGEAGRERLEARFSITNNVARTEDLYETLLR